MKRLIIIPLLFLTLFCNAQFIKGGGMFLKSGNTFVSVPPVPPVDYTAEYDTVLAAFSTQPHDTIKTLQNALVYSLDTAGYWDRMDLLYIFAAHDSVNGYVNWIDPGTFDAFVGATGYIFTQWEGFTGDGSASRIRSGYIPSEDTINYSRNSASMGVYLRLGPDVALRTVVGTYASGNDYRLAYKNNSDNTSQWQINSASSVYETSSAYPPGLFIVSRTAANACALYKNGASVEAVADASAGLSDAEFYMLDIGTGSAQQVSIVYLMNGTANATEADKINDIFETYMDGIGSGIQ
jgi:hypothetical protein